MKILQVHNFYKIGGGEDTVVANEKELLEQNGHEVITYYRNNSEIDKFNLINKVKLLKDTTYSTQTAEEISAILNKEKPDVCHVHNFLPLISPAVYKACKKQQIPVIQTLHNYRLICTNGILFKDGKICEKCLNKSSYNAVKFNCYRNSKIQTFAVARMLEKHKKRKTWNNDVTTYICLTQFAKQKFIAHGLPKNKLIVKGNFIPTPAVFEKNNTAPYFVYVGRLEPDKGLRTIMEIAPKSPFPIQLIGEGSLTDELRKIKNIEVLGKQPYQKVLELISSAKALLFASLWYEGMPMTIIEAFASHTTVIASDSGAMASMIRHQLNGLLFEPGNAIALLSEMKKIVADSNLSIKLSTVAYQDYLELYSPESNYRQLMDIYALTIANKKV